MQSRLAVSKLNRLLVATTRYQKVHPPPMFSSTSGGDDMEDAMTQGVDPEGETDPKPDNDDNNHDEYHHHDTKSASTIINPTRPPPPPTLSSSSKLETSGVHTPVDPQFQQKRSNSTEFSCAGGLNDSPWPDDDDDNKKSETKTLKEQRQEQEEDDKQYFEHHKASPLSEIEIVDSRKPLTRVTDGTADSYFGDEQVLTWTPDQLDTAEQSLLRATQMFRESAANGIPEWPHSRRLRQLRGEG